MLWRKLSSLAPLALLTTAALDGSPWVLLVSRGCVVPFPGGVSKLYSGGREGYTAVPVPTPASEPCRHPAVTVFAGSVGEAWAESGTRARSSILVASLADFGASTLGPRASSTLRQPPLNCGRSPNDGAGQPMGRYRTCCAGARACGRLPGAAGVRDRRGYGALSSSIPSDRLV